MAFYGHRSISRECRKGLLDISASCRGERYYGALVAPTAIGQHCDMFIQAVTDPHNRACAKLLEVRLYGLRRHDKLAFRVCV